MKTRLIVQIVAWIMLVLSLPLAALDAVMVLGGLFTMSNADTAIVENWIWFLAGPFSFLPALCLGILLALIFRFSDLRKTIHKTSQHPVWLAIAWLSVGSSCFTWIHLWGSGFAHELNPTFYLSRISLPMLIAAFCLWLVGIPSLIGEDV